ncbi:DUF3343 domain-containing protein [Treponema denticola]|uniref:Putative Se/S carrier protein-like domain-containing protein n=1 Tax=Treponema denticola SP33 TaxID=999437 RepID=M2BW21_TREDN|nr:DUF3343 domain-containing protein [Treponema denticola]EMB25693.1 hypothetical protein HMPREF9733_00825 [Treponema denticola SP33]EPF37047.1 hypothetical protein HMPREF9732_01076 [Treponema denticola SP32]
MNYIITFGTTTAAIQCDSMIKADPINAKLVPIPGFLKAGCGFACLFQNMQKKEVESWISKNNISYEEMLEVRYEGKNIIPA